MSGALELLLTLSLFNQSKNHLPPRFFLVDSFVPKIKLRVREREREQADLAADEKPYMLTITHTT